MAKAESRATATWHDSLMQGSGQVSAGSGAFTDQPITWAARTERTGATKTTSPEELISAAYASCFSMAFSNALAQNGTPPDELRVTATTTFEHGSGGVKISTLQADVNAKVPGIDDATFQKLANQAKDGCPVSAALKGNVQISVDAQLQQ